MLEKSGRSLSPCAEVNGDEVEAYLLEAGVLHLTVMRRPTGLATRIIMSNA